MFHGWGSHTPLGGVPQPIVRSPSPSGGPVPLWGSPHLMGGGFHTPLGVPQPIGGSMVVPPPPILRPPPPL